MSAMAGGAGDRPAHPGSIFLRPADQSLAWIDLDSLAARQAQNRLADQLSGLWLNYTN